MATENNGSIPKMDNVRLKLALTYHHNYDYGHTNADNHPHVSAGGIHNLQQCKRNTDYREKPG